MGVYPLFGEHVGVMDATELGEASLKGSIQPHDQVFSTQD
jgi:hypothetical protein